MRNRFLARAGWKLIATIFIASASLWAGDDVLLKAMKDEMARSMDQLRLENLDKPYFMAYRLQDTTGGFVSAIFGSLLASSENRSRFFSVEIRVGDYKLDNTNFLTQGPGAFSVGIARLSLEDNYNELRRQIWLATDAAYKKAVEDLGKKRAALQNRTRSEELPDFTPKAPDEVPAISDPPAAWAESRAEAEKLVREISALFKSMPQVATSTVSWSSAATRRLYVNSEGVTIARTIPQVTLAALAGTYAPDGMPLQDFVAAYGKSSKDLPKKEDLAASIREMGERLAKLQQAPLLERYNGPVLFEGQAAAEIFGQAFAPRLLAVRRPISDNPQMERMAGQSENPFLDKLGARVLPDFLNVDDDATRKEFQGAQLMGDFPVDDDGVPARDTKLIEQGFLKTLLATRNPVRGIKQSTGSRRGSGPAPSNLFITAQKGLSDKELKEQFLKVVEQRGKEYGIVIRRMGNPSLRALRESAAFAIPGGEGTPVEGPILAYKVFPDGHEELVRNAALSGITPAAFKDILAASASQTVYSAPFSARTSFAFSPLDGQNVVSFAVPSLLFEDITVTKPRGDIPKPPVAKHPFFEK